MTYVDFASFLISIVIGDFRLQRGMDQRRDMLEDQFNDVGHLLCRRRYQAVECRSCLFKIGWFVILHHFLNHRGEVQKRR